MRNEKRIGIVLKNIPWKEFITQNCQVSGTALDTITTKVLDNLDHIEKIWKSWPDYRLGQLLINEHYVPDTTRMYNVEEDNWLINNKILNIEDIKFWGSNYDINMTKLPKTNYKLLKDLDDSHIAAIIDFHGEQSIKINEGYLEYFNKRLKKD